MQNNLIRKCAEAILVFLALMALMIVPAVAKTKPTVAVIKADWCSACQKLEPIMTELMKEYVGKVEFLALDVTSDEKVAQSRATAKNLGLGDFFSVGCDQGAAQWRRAHSMVHQRSYSGSSSTPKPSATQLTKLK